MDHIPVIEANGSTSITSLNMTYSQLVQMMAPNAYKVHSYQLSSITRNQLVMPMVYEKKNSNGNNELITINSRISLKQYQNTIIKNVDSLKLLLDGNNSININVQPSENIQLILDVTELRRDEILDSVDKKLSEDL